MDQGHYTRGEKEFLLKIVRTTLEKYLQTDEKFEPQTVNQRLWEKRGVFVTLHKKGELRGCIGYIEPVEPIMMAVRDNAIAAANDPRFLPLAEEELKEIEIEISILTPLEKTVLSEIKKGDGVMIKRGRAGATYLPQVWDDLPEPEVFFGSLCQKAGLERECYKDQKTEFYKYSAIVFKEGEIL
ncbi:MAG: AmmeMemoRadiSam system protein A [Patescibacteria group bacterium]